MEKPRENDPGRRRRHRARGGTGQAAPPARPCVELGGSTLGTPLFPHPIPALVTQPWGPLHPSAISMATRCARRIAMATGRATQPRHGDCRHRALSPWRPSPSSQIHSLPDPPTSGLGWGCCSSGMGVPKKHTGGGRRVPGVPRDWSTRGWGSTPGCSALGSPVLSSDSSTGLDLIPGDVT